MRIKPGLTAGFAESVEGFDEHGRRVVAVDWPVTEGEFDQIEKGYRCLNCMEVFGSPFPDACVVCGYHVADKQTDDIAKQHRGRRHYGPTPDDHPDLQDKRDRESWVKRDGIWLP